jgi:uncharacterized membrane protein YfcA
MEYLFFGLMTLLVMFGAFMQSLIGLGYVLLVAPFLVLYGPDFVPVPMLLCGLFLPLLMVWRDHRSIDFSGVKLAICGRVLGNLIAVRLITLISRNTFMLVFGVLVIIAVILSVSNLKFRPTVVGVGIAGLFSGIMGTLAGLGGQPMAILYQNEKGSVIRGTLSGFSILGTVLSLIFLGVAGRFTSNDLKLFSYMVPGIVAGIYLAKYAIRFVDKGYIRKAMMGVSFLAAIAVIVKALR